MEGLSNTPSITFARNYLYTRVQIDCSQPLYLRTSKASAKHSLPTPTPYPVKSTVQRWRSVLSRFCPRIQPLNKITRK